MSISGIYKITYQPTNQSYIGESENVGKRIFDHAFGLFTNSHSNSTLQQLWNSNPNLMDWRVEILAIIDNTEIRKSMEKYFVNNTVNCISHTGERQREVKDNIKEYMRNIALFYSNSKRIQDKSYLLPVLLIIEKELNTFLTGEFKEGFIYSSRKKIYTLCKYFTDTKTLSKDELDILDKIRKDIQTFKGNTAS